MHAKGDVHSNTTRHRVLQAVMLQPYNILRKILDNSKVAQYILGFGIPSLLRAEYSQSVQTQQKKQIALRFQCSFQGKTATHDTICRMIDEFLM